MTLLNAYFYTDLRIAKNRFYSCQLARKLQIKTMQTYGYQKFANIVKDVNALCDINGQYGGGEL